MTNLARVGQTVLLKGGKKSKRKFNNEEATVEVVPTRGCWMTVRLSTSNANSGPSLKWHKSGFQPAAARSKSDPLATFDDLVSIKILSYVYGECPKVEDTREHTLWLLAAIRQNKQLRLVSPLWNGIVEKVTPSALGTISLDFFGGNWVRGLFKWICDRPGMKLSSVKFRYAELGDVPLISELITVCDTEELRQLELGLNKSGLPYSSSSKYALDDLQGSRPVVDLVEESNSAAPNCVDAKEQKTLHDLVARECPNLSVLAAKINLPADNPDYSDYISKALLSMPTIKNLTLSLGSFSTRSRLPNRIDSNVFARLIQNLPSLVSLKVSTRNSILFYMRRFHIASQTLENIDVVDTGKKSIISCSCPKLKTYICNGSPYGNGTMPLLSGAQYNRLDRYLFERDGHEAGYRKDMVVTAGTFEFPHWNVPDSCLVTLLEFYPWGSYEIYNRNAGEAANAEFQTFDGAN